MTLHSLFHKNCSSIKALGFSVAILFVFSFSTTSLAAGSWLSKVHHQKGSSGSLSSVSRASKDSDKSLFDVVVSIYKEVPGNDDPENDEAGEEQTTYESIIEYWADAVCEESNGTHKLKKVRIFQEGRFSSQADVVWIEKDQPRADVSGFGQAGSHIYTGDIFKNGGAGGADYNLLADPEGAGYTLGHEWGHYVYALYDEYVGSAADAVFYFPRSTDTPVDKSIMNRQWSAVGGNFDWLNHSTSNNYQAATAQGRVYGESGWDVLIQPTTDDPRDGDRRALAKRTRYSNLIGKEPTDADGWIKTELPGSQADCRSELEIIWMADEIEMQIVIDRSGSMDGSPIENAKLASQNLVTAVDSGETALGVVSFATDVTQDQAIVDIPEDGAATKTGIINVISTISSDGWTSMYDAAEDALTKLQAYKAANGTEAAQVVFLLSDGEDNDSDYASYDSVVADYQANEVALITFGYGSGAPGGILKSLAEETGGLFFSSPTTLQQIQNAFFTAQSAITNSRTVESASATVPGSHSSSVEFEVDSTLKSFTLFANYEGAEADLGLALLDANDEEVNGANISCTESGLDTSCVVQVEESDLDVQEVGTWSLEVENTTEEDIELAVDVLAAPLPGPSYDVELASIGGNTVTYPEPIVLTARVSRGRSITDVNLLATMTDPLGNSTDFIMNDNGTDGDAHAQDGIYSAIIGYGEIGTYTVDVRVDNNDGRAYYTNESMIFSANIDGILPLLGDTESVDENFTRVASLQLTIENGLYGGWGDDHSNWAPGTSMEDNNEDIPGNIDFAGDADFFQIGVTNTTGDLVVRVSNLALGMEPVLNVYMSDGVTEVLEATLDDSSSADGYIYGTIPAASLDPTGVMIARVTHASASADQGTYSISAGSTINSDMVTRAEPAPEDDDDDDSDDSDDSGNGIAASSSGGCNLTPENTSPIQGISIFLILVLSIALRRYAIKQR